MTKRKRTDIHRPSAINPAEYDFVAVIIPESMANTNIDTIEEAIYYKNRLKQHMEKTGGKFSSHEHGGICMVCGNPFTHYKVIYYHRPTNEYIAVGRICAEKIDFSGQKAISAFVYACQKREKKLEAFKNAKKYLENLNLFKAWEFFENYAKLNSNIKQKYCIIYNLVSKIINYGYLTDKQINYLRIMLNKFEKENEETEKKSIPSIPYQEGERVTVRGKILNIKMVEDLYQNAKWKVLIEHEDGWKLWGTLPSSIFNAEKGDIVEFTLTYHSSKKDDPSFGFFSRPKNGKIIERKNKGEETYEECNSDY